MSNDKHSWDWDTDQELTQQDRERSESPDSECEIVTRGSQSKTITLLGNNVRLQFPRKDNS